MSDSDDRHHLTLQVAASFVFPFEADLARLRLDWEGIPSRLTNVALAGWFWTLQWPRAGFFFLAALALDLFFCGIWILLVFIALAR